MRTKDQDREYQRARYNANEVAREKRKASARAYAARIRAASALALSDTPAEPNQI
jgi:hypothetical protein